MEIRMSQQVMFKKIDFDVFWDAYDKKVGALMCKAKWNMKSRSDQEKILEHVKLYKDSQPNKFFRKDPEKYLDQECWLDEIITNDTKKFAKPTGKLTYNEILNLKNGDYKTPPDPDIFSKVKSIKDGENDCWVYK